MKHLLLTAAGLTALSFAPAHAAPALLPHKAVYKIDLVATHSGSQIINIGGEMTYEWRKDCGAWVTDHAFTLQYNYADSPGMRIDSAFSTYEAEKGDKFDYTSRRKRNGEPYQSIRGRATLGVDGKGGKAVYTSPEKLSYDLSPGTLFPIGHTVEVIRRAEAGDKFYTAAVFDGSDEDGPIEISTFIGGKVAPKDIASGGKIDAGMLKGAAWRLRMAVFPEKQEEEISDYEMSLVFHENGIISDMLIEYADFSVTQKLVSLEKGAADSCASPPDIKAVR